MMPPCETVHVRPAANRAMPDRQRRATALVMPRTGTGGPGAAPAASLSAALLSAAAVLLALCFAVLPGAARGGEHQDTIVSHGISVFGDLKYGPDFEHFDYVNPDAPKGGEMHFRGTGASSTFDSLNPFILKGEPAQGLGWRRRCSTG